MTASILFIVLNTLLGLSPINTAIALCPYSSGYLGRAEPSVTLVPYSQLITCFLSRPSHTQTVSATQKEAPQDIQWFKEKMKISPKYMERQEGILGMSWGHFFTMVFLLLFAAGALLIFFLRYRRTKQILNMIKEEVEHGSKG